MNSRRTFLKQTVAGLAGAALFSPRPVWSAAPAAAAPIRIGSCRLDLRQAQRAGVDGVELVINDNAEKLRFADPALRRQYQQEMAETGVVVSSLMLSLLNSNPLAADPRAPSWLEQSVDAAQDLGAGVILVPFFGRANLLKDGQLNRADADRAVERLKAAAPRARRAGVALALENTLSAQQNARLLEEIGNDAVRVYYDVGNSTRAGYDVPAEIRFLRDRIACFHFKDGRHYLGEGDIRFEPIAAAIRDIGYRGWIVMETANPSNDPVADARRNAAFIRKLLGAG